MKTIPTKDEHEFYPANTLPWTDVPGSPGVRERVMSRADDVILTRLAQWAPGVDTSTAGVITHSYIEEVYLLDGELTDLTLGATFGPGHYACRPVGMPHGPYRTNPGCTMLEIRSQ